MSAATVQVNPVSTNSFTHTAFAPGMVSFKQVLPTIESIATGTPKHTIRQSDAARLVAQLPNLEQNRSLIEKLYQNTRIDTRHLAIDLLSEDAIATLNTSSIKDRMRLYQEHAVPLAERVAERAIAAASAPKVNLSGYTTLDIRNNIRQIVFVSSTGFVAPGVDAALIERLGLRRDIARVTINFMGCAAAMNGLRVASDYVRANPTHKSLVVCLELSSINAVFEDEINDVIIHSIFGDGCAAVVIGACTESECLGQGRVVIRDHLSYLAENTQDGITLGIQDSGITCKLSRQLPDYIEAGVGGIIERYLANHQLTKNDIDLWAAHPGGTRIIQKVQRSLDLTDDQVADSWEVLRQYGNMLSPSVLFVMQRMLNRLEQSRHPEDNFPTPVDPSEGWQDTAQPSLTGLAFSFSPGVGVEGILFQTL